MKPLLFVPLIAALWLSPAAVFGHSDHAPAPAAKEVLLARPVPIGTFMLADTGRQVFGPERFHGRWSFVFFGFTHCPDVCPAVLDGMAAVRQAVIGRLGEDQAPAILFVSVDPERDSPEHLASYAAHFGPGVEAASAPQEHLRRFERYFGASHRIIKRKTPGAYDVAHSGEIYLIDPSAHHVATFWPPIEPEAWARLFLSIHDGQARRQAGGSQ